MTDLLLSVRPAGAAWLLECPDGLAPQEFSSPAEAEEQAHKLAKCLAQVGLDVRIHVCHDAEAVVGAADADCRDGSARRASRG